MDNLSDSEYSEIVIQEKPAPAEESSVNELEKPKKQQKPRKKMSRLSETTRYHTGKYLCTLTTDLTATASPF